MQWTLDFRCFALDLAERQMMCLNPLAWGRATKCPVSPTRERGRFPAIFSDATGLSRRDPPHRRIRIDRRMLHAAMRWLTRRANTLSALRLAAVGIGATGSFVENARSSRSLKFLASGQLRIGLWLAARALPLRNPCTSTAARMPSGKSGPSIASNSFKRRYCSAIAAG